MATVKISKYLSEAGIASRRKAEILVTQGMVFINGKPMTDVAARIDPEHDHVTYDGQPVKITKRVYYLLNKPLGYTSTTADRHAEQLITQLVPQIPKVWPVGRLDKLTSGLILLTNDGRLTQKITHPRYQIEKEYEIVTSRPLAATDIDMLQRGIRLEDGFVKPDLFKQIRPGVYRIVIHSGKKRVVRRLIEKTGKSVSGLKRVRIGRLLLENIPSGKWRSLTPEEISKLLAK